MRRVFVYSIFVLALIERVWFDLGPNFEIITLASILSAFYLDRKTAFILTLSIVILSDLIIGNTNIFIFTWSGFIFPILAINIFKKLRVNNIFSGTLAGISSNLFFFFWTNFGVWALDSWGMYPNTALGLAQFLKYQLISTLFFVPIGFIVFEAMLNNLFTRIKATLSQFVFV